MEKLASTTLCTSARAEVLQCVKRQARAGEDREQRGNSTGSASETFVSGVIVDSWVENAVLPEAGPRLVLQVSPRGHSDTLVIVEADAALLSDRLWLADLSENLCHGSLVQALGSRSCNGLFAATRLLLTR